jgi:Glu-tRNA(Gln) amidotransferase subunit E-like FAD-binding protein
MLSELGTVSEVHNEKFEGVNTRFAENKIALDAALRAQKDLVDAQNKANSEASEKQSAAFTKQIDAMTLFINTAMKGIEDRMNDIKSRLDRGEGTTGGAAMHRTERRLDTGLVVSIVVGCVAAVALVVALLPLAVHH